MDFRRRRTLFNRCQPDLALAPGDDRFDLHPAVRRIPGVDAEIRRLKGLPRSAPS